MSRKDHSSDRKTAAARQQEYAELPKVDPDNGRVKPKFIHWLRGKFGVTVAERKGNKPQEGGKVGTPYSRVQHRPIVRPGDKRLAA